MAPHRRVAVVTAQPIFILVRPQLGENIGKAARAMLNFGLERMRIVAPRDGWPNPDAGPAAAGADRVLDDAELYDSLEEAIADCHLVLATTYREQVMTKDAVTPKQAVALSNERLGRSEQVAFLFGAERSGMTNDEMAFADATLRIPVNPDFGSINLAQAVVLLAYEFFQSADETPPLIPGHPDGAATKEAIVGLIDHLEHELAQRGFFRSQDREETQRRMLINLIENARMSHQEVQTWRGIIKTLTRHGLKRPSSLED